MTSQTVLYPFWKCTPKDRCVTVRILENQIQIDSPSNSQFATNVSVINVIRLYVYGHFCQMWASKSWGLGRGWDRATLFLIGYSGTRPQNTTHSFKQSLAGRRFRGDAVQQYAATDAAKAKVKSWQLTRWYISHVLSTSVLLNH